MLIYVVEGSTGAYSDRNDWICKVFKHEERANRFCKMLQKEADRVFDLSKENPRVPLWETTKWIKKEFQKYILNIDYTGVYFNVFAVEYDEMEMF